MIEVFQMKGVPPLVLEHKVEGRSVSLASLFAPGGLQIDVVTREPELPFAQRSTSKDLLALVTEQRKPSSPEVWTAALVIANASSDYKDSLSLVISKLSDRHDVAVVFGEPHQALEQPALSMFLSAAHELTHFFGLHHPDWEGTSFRQDSTIEGYSLVETVRWKLSDASVQHLRFAPAAFVRPDGGPFDRVLPEHFARHQKEPAEPYTIATSLPSPVETPSVVAPEPRTIRPAIAMGSDLKGKTTVTRDTFHLYLTVERVGAPLSDVIVTSRTDKGTRELLHLRQPDPDSQPLELDVPLQIGKNHITVSVTDRSQRESHKTVEVVRENIEQKLIAVVLGAAVYQHVQPLKYAVNDARAIRDHLISRGLTKDRLFYEENPDLQTIRTALGTWLWRTAGPKDTAVVYFAGHGAAEVDAEHKGDGLNKYLLPVGADLEDLYATAFPMTELASVLHRVKADTLLVILDTCFSGAAGGRTVEAEGVRAASRLDSAFLVNASGAGRILLTACGPNEVAQESVELGHGVFTYFMLKAWSGEADRNGDGVDVPEIYSWVSQKVKEKTSNKQKPMLVGEVRDVAILWRAGERRASPGPGR